MKLSLHFRGRSAAANLGLSVCVYLMGLLVCAVWVDKVEAQYRYDECTADSGLPQNIIRGITQDRRGYLWIATLNGLARFDGIRFTIYDRSTTPAIASNRFNSLYAAPNGDLWMDTERGGMTRYRNGEFRTFGPSEGVVDNRTEGLTGDDAGNVWILSRGQIERWNERAERFEPDPAQVQNIHFVRTLWRSGFCGWDGTTLYCFIKGKSFNCKLPASLQGISLWGVALDQDGSKWLESIDGSKFHIAPNETEIKPVDPASSATTIYRDRGGHTFAVQIGKRLTRSIEYMSAGHSVSTMYTKVYEDRESNLWLGTEGRGLLRLQRESIVGYSVEQGLAGRNAYPILADSTGAVWIGLWVGSGLSRFDKGSFTNFGAANGLPTAPVTALAEDAQGRMWFAMNSGVFLFVDGQIHKAPLPALPQNTIVQAIHHDHDGSVWLGTSLGLFHQQGGQMQEFGVKDGLASDDVRVILPGKSGALWIGGYGGLTKLSEGKFTHWTERDGLASNNIRSLYEDSDETLWIGTYDGGLGRFKDGSFVIYSTRNGLFDNGAFQVLEDAKGNLWMSSNRGIYRVSKHELNEVAAHRRSTIFSVAYGKADGMINVECNGGVSPAGARAQDGKLWFPTQDGVAVVDPELLANNPQPPPVVIEASRIDRDLASVDGPLRIGSGKENLEIVYTALSFINSNQIRFRYRLEGLDSDWVDAGSRRTAYYSHIPPGHYVFQVIAVNRDGVWNYDGQRLPITVLAPFYRTWWFACVALLVTISLVAFAWYRRGLFFHREQALQQAFSQQLIASQERERKRIAGELHDSIGQRLVVINNLALLSLRPRENATAEQDRTSALEEIRAEAELAIREAREISYDLRPFQLDRLGLTKGIASILRSVGSASAIAINSQLDDIDDFFPDDLRINLYRVVQETMNNILKHAGASQINVRVRREGDSMVLIIEDNGKGFPSATSASEMSKSGAGLTGMKQRALLLGGKLDVRSVPGHGTVVKFEIVGKEVHRV